MKKILVFALLFVFTAIAPELAALSTPTGLKLSSTSTTIEATWTVSNQTIDGYKLTWQVADSSTAYPLTATIDNPQAASFTIKGLTPKTKYEVNLAVYDQDGDSNSTSASITTTDLDPSITLVAQGTIQIDVSEYKDSVDTYDVYVGSTPGDDDIYTDTGVDVEEVTEVANLEDGTYYILVDVNYTNGNTGSSGEIEFDVGDFGTFFSESGDIENGCFIGSSSPTGALPLTLLLVMFPAVFCFSRFRRAFFTAGSLVLLLTVFSTSAQCFENVEYNNLLGIKAGLFDPTESLQGDTYDSIVPVSLFYERMFGPYFSLDVSAGYTRASGHAVTESGEKTGVEADLDLIPVSASANINIPVHSLITCYLGVGGDYWIFEEDYLDNKEKNDIGGYHGKAGFKMFTGDIEYFKRGGIILEASYTVLDRFGDNEVDLGGWTYSLGVMYCF